MDPFDGPINESLAHRHPGTGWLTDPSLALISVALVDIWKGVGLATLIYIAGMVAIPQEYYEAAKVDGAGAWSNFRHITLPLLRPATITVCCSRSSAVSVVRPDLGDDRWRSRLRATSSPRSSTSSTRPASSASPPRATSCSSSSWPRSSSRSRGGSTGGGRPMRNRLWRVGGGIAAILVALVVFIVPFLFIVFTAGKTQAESSFLEFSWPTEWAFFDNIATVLQNRDFLLVTRVREQHGPDGRRRHDHGRARRDGRLRAAAPEVAVEPARQRPRAGRPHHPAGRGAHDLGAAGPRAVQDHPRAHRGARRVRPVVLHPAVPRVRRDDPARARRGGHHRRRRADQAVLPRDLPAAEVGDRDGDRRPGCDRVQRLPSRCTSPRATRTRPCS